jgi:hypothetical protein
VFSCFCNNPYVGKPPTGGAFLATRQVTRHYVGYHGAWSDTWVVRATRRTNAFMIYTKGSSTSTCVPHHVSTPVQCAAYAAQLSSPWHNPLTGAQDF